MKKEDIDLDDYVTNKSLDGLFLMVGKKSRRSGPTRPHR